MTRAATPRPWHISRHDSGLIVGPGNEEPLVAGDADERDAALIVRAVNAHDDLVGALEQVRNRHADTYKDAAGTYCLTCRSGYPCPTRRIVDAALGDPEPKEDR